MRLWHTDLISVLPRDKEKNKYCFNNNITLIRIPYTHYNSLCLNDLLENSQFIIKKEVI